MDWTDTYNDLPRISGLPLYMYVYISLKVSYYTIYIYSDYHVKWELQYERNKRVQIYWIDNLVVILSFKKETLSKKKKNSSKNIHF